VVRQFGGEGLDLPALHTRQTRAFCVTSVDGAVVETLHLGGEAFDLVGGFPAQFTGSPSVSTVATVTSVLCSQPLYQFINHCSYAFLYSMDWITRRLSARTIFSASASASSALGAMVRSLT
jgi:hypothetical protein